MVDFLKEANRLKIQPFKWVLAIYAIDYDTIAIDGNNKAIILNARDFSIIKEFAIPDSIRCICKTNTSLIFALDGCQFMTLPYKQH